MIVNHEHRFIFLKTRKTAGTSVEIALSKYCGPDDVITPIAAEDEEKRRALGFRGPQNYELPKSAYGAWDWIRFLARGRRKGFYNHAPAAFVRRFVGEEIWNGYYKFSFERDPYDKAVSRYFWSTRKKKRRPEVADYLERAPLKLLSNWDVYAIDDEIVVDFLGRFENLRDDLAQVTTKLGLPELDMPRSKGGYRKDKRHYSHVLDGRARKRIERVCARELETFGYRWQDAPEDAG